MKRVAWVGVAIAIAVAGAWGYGALVRQENDSGARVRLLAIAEDQTLDLSFSRAGRIVTRVPDEGESVASGDIVARVEQPGLAEDGADYQRQRAELKARELTRRQNVRKPRRSSRRSRARRSGSRRLVREGIAPAADLELLRHRRDATEAGIRALETEKNQLEAQDNTLESPRRKGRALREGGHARREVRRHRPHAAPSRGRVGRGGAAHRDAPDRHAVPSRRSARGAPLDLSPSAAA